MYRTFQLSAMQIRKKVGLCGSMNGLFHVSHKLFHIFWWKSIRKSFSNLSFIVGLEILIAVTVKNTIVWRVTPCSRVEVHRRVGRPHCYHLHCRRLSQASNRKETAESTVRSLLHARLAYPSPWRWWQKVTPKRPYLYISLRYVLSQETALVTVTAPSIWSHLFADPAALL
jgi:hypothetical protein